jgi:hypothetical protein
MIKRIICLVILLILLLVSCQQPSTPTALTPTTVQSSPTTPPNQQPSPTAEALLPTPLPEASATPSTPALLPFTIDWTKPFAETLDTGKSLQLTTWTEQPYQGEDIALPIDLSQVVNPGVLAGLTAKQKDFLSRNGFVVLHSQEAQFGDIRVETAKKTGQPYYLTVDAGYHALHLLFDELLKSLEREIFRLKIIAITQSTLEQVRLDLSQAQDSSIQTDMQQALAYLSVALKLFDPTTQIDPSVADLASQQVDQIMAAGGRAKSVLFPDFEDDYGAYLPVGHYAGDPELEAYYRGMTWYGRMHFLLQDQTNPDFVPSRLPLIVTQALRRAQVDAGPASDAWAELHRLLDFVIGPSDDAGPLEYAALMDAVYGNDAQILDLADPVLWQDFLVKTDQLPVPQINSLFVASTKDLSPEKGWRFMGQRFTLDGMIMQNVVFDKVDPKTDGTRRELPSGLDVMSAFGSTTAYQELEKAGITTFPNYNDQMNQLQQAVQTQPEEQWLGRFYDGWLYSFLPVVQTKDASYPAYMQTSPWTYKNLNTALGSWAELKHDTILYTKMPEMGAGGGPPMSGPAPSYVEPNPQAFYRMAYIAKALSCGLQPLIESGPCVLVDFWMDSADSNGYVISMGGLGVRLEKLGDIAVKELAGQPLTIEDISTITSCLGMIECVNEDTGYNFTIGEMPKVPVVAAVAGAENSVLEVGVGNVDRLYVIIPHENQWEVAQGGIFSYYEFSQPRDQRLTDEAWREMLANGEVTLPVWASNFILPGGAPTESLFFRVGDVYIVTKAGDKLNVREQPTKSAKVNTQARTKDYIEIVGGPVQSDGYTWWKVKVIPWASNESIEGWAVENQEWYVRSYRVNQPEE